MPVAAGLFGVLLGCAGDSSPDRVVTYKSVEGRELRLYLFEPERGERPHAAIVFFSGGGWYIQDPAQFYPFARELAKDGLLVAAADYRVKKPDGADPDASVADARSAVRWLRGHAAELGVDPQRIAASGGSAGGHLALMAALSSRFDDAGEDASVSARPDALVLFNPMIDQSPGGDGHEQVEGYWRDISPLHNLQTGMPPALFMMGTEDEFCPVETARRFCAGMTGFGNDCELVLYPGVKHGFFNRSQHGGRYFGETLAETRRFLGELGFLVD